MQRIRGPLLLGALCLIARVVLGINHSLFPYLFLARFAIGSFWAGLASGNSITALPALIPVLVYLASVLVGFWKQLGASQHADFNGPLRPLIFPCHTTHRRLFPKEHSFSHSYLQVGIPVGWRGSSGSMVGADEQLASEGKSKAKSWYSVDAADYLERGNGHLGLDGKLDAYLKSQGDALANYAHAYLVTAARFLGYHFNPVSFWYLFSKDMQLEAMVLEVNNTFDERRMYYMKRPADAETTADREAKFSNAWPKDFHVSPFNSRKGGYALIASNPFGADGPKLDNTITLKSSKDHAKIVARIFSNAPAIDPSQLSIGSKLNLILAWWWVGLVTFPRILREAGKLFILKGLRVWFRPEVVRTSIGRKDTERERAIETCFRQYLSDRLQAASGKISTQVRSLTYTPSSTVAPDSLTIASGKQADSTAASADLTMRVLTPEFYSALAVASTPAAYILSGKDVPADRRTFETSSPELLAALLSEPMPAARTSEGILVRLRWSLLSALRGGKTAHPLDSFARAHLPLAASSAYLCSTLHLVLAQKLCFGSVELFDILLQILEFAFAWTVAGSLVKALTELQASNRASRADSATTELVELMVLAFLGLSGGLSVVLRE